MALAATIWLSIFRNVKLLQDRSMNIDAFGKDTVRCKIIGCLNTYYSFIKTYSEKPKISTPDAIFSKCTFYELKNSCKMRQIGIRGTNTKIAQQKRQLLENLPTKKQDKSKGNSILGFQI